MGFFSSLNQQLFGGSNSSSGSQGTSGFALLPPEIQKSYTGYSDMLNKLMADTAGNKAAFTPTQFSDAEKNAISNVNKGFAPTADSINSDIAMQQNPYDKYVIDEINRQSGGDFSILKQAMSQAGQSGSNRGLLGANDIDLSRTNQIGKFKQEGYANALQNALSTLPGMRAGDAQNQLAVGENVRNLTDKTNQSEYANLGAFAQLLGILPTNGGSQQTSSSQSQTNTGMFKQMTL